MHRIEMSVGLYDCFRAQHNTVRARAWRELCAADATPANQLCAFPLSNGISTVTAHADVSHIHVSGKLY